MELLFPIFRYFPHGGLQRDMLRIAECAAKRGHSVTICCMSWEGDYPASPRISINLLPVKGWSNHARAVNFAAAVEELKKAGKYDLVFGFNRMPGLNLYFAADNCFARNAMKHSLLVRRLLPRYRTFLRFERAVFDAQGTTRILYLTPGQKRDFMQVYGTPEARFVLLPPGIPADRKRPADPAPLRKRKRQELKIGAEELLLLQVGSGFRTKGVDRTLRAFAALPEKLRNRSRLIIAGRDSSDRFQRLAGKLDIANRVIFAGGRDDIPELLLAADLLVHPARNEATGTVLIEAIAAGTPVLCSANCGFANYVEESGGTVLSVPLREEALAASLGDILISCGKLDKMKFQVINYGRDADFYHRAEVAVDVIEEMRK